MVRKQEQKEHFESEQVTTVLANLEGLEPSTNSN